MSFCEKILKFFRFFIFTCDNIHSSTLKCVNVFEIFFRFLIDFIFVANFCQCPVTLYIALFIKFILRWTILKLLELSPFYGTKQNAILFQTGGPSLRHFACSNDISHGVRSRILASRSRKSQTYSSAVRTRRDIRIPNVGGITNCDIYAITWSSYFCLCVPW